MVEVFSYEEMEQKQLPQEILQEMRRFSYARYDSFEGFDCVSLEILDYKNLLLSKGSVLFYLEKERIICFTSRKDEIAVQLAELEKRYPSERIMYVFFEELTKGDDVAFDAIEKETMALEEALILTGKRD